MDDDIQHIGIVTKISAEEADEIQGGGPIVDGERTANPEYTGELSSFRSRLNRHRLLEPGDRLAAVALLGQGDGLLGWNAGCR